MFDLKNEFRYKQDFIFQIGSDNSYLSFYA